MRKQTKAKPATSVAAEVWPKLVQTGPHSFELAPDPRAYHWAAIDDDNRARNAMRALREAGADPVKQARALADLLGTVCALLDIPGALTGRDLGISPDAVREYKALVGRVGRAVFEDRNADKRRRTYLENRIIRAAEKCDGTAKGLERACQSVVSLCVDDVHTEPLAAKLVRHETKLLACVRAAMGRKPRRGRFPPPGGYWGKKSVDAYESAFTALCEAIGVAVATPATRASERSRIARKPAR